MNNLLRRIITADFLGEENKIEALKEILKKCKENSEEVKMEIEKFNESIKTRYNFVKKE